MRMLPSLDQVQITGFGGQISSPSQSQRIQLSHTVTQVHVPVPETASREMHALVADDGTHRVLLQFDDIRYEKSNGVYYEVYINPPAGLKLDIHSPAYVGNLALFGLKPQAKGGQHSSRARSSPGTTFPTSSGMRRSASLPILPFRASGENVGMVQFPGR